MTRITVLASTVLVAVAAVAMPNAAIAAATPSAAAATPSAAARVGCSISPAHLKPGRTGTFGCTAGTFGAGESVRFRVSGADGATASIAVLASFAVPLVATEAADATWHSSSATIVKRAAANGSTSIRVQVPKNGSGTYTVTASGASRTVTSSLSVLSAGGTVARSTSARAADVAAAGSRADSVFGWVLAIIAAFAGVAFLSERSERLERSGRSGRPGRSCRAQA